MVAKFLVPTWLNFCIYFAQFDSNTAYSVFVWRSAIAVYNACNTYNSTQPPFRNHGLLINIVTFIRSHCYKLYVKWNSPLNRVTSAISGKLSIVTVRANRGTQKAGTETDDLLTQVAVSRRTFLKRHRVFFVLEDLVIMLSFVRIPGACTLFWLNFLTLHY